VGVTDDDGFRLFVVTRQASLTQLARLLVDDPGDADDLVQSTFLRMYLKWGRLRAHQAADAYARTVLIRLAGRARRRHWRREVPTEEGGMPDLQQRDHIEEFDVGRTVRAALARLPWEQRAVLVCRYYAQLSEAEIADLLGCPVGTVKSRANRALAALRSSGLLEGVRESDDV
jgi:RNA polymerase sigma-70 factor (sigma-E family)